MNIRQMRIAAARLLLLLAVLPGIAPGQVRDPLPVPDVLGFRTLKCDFHIHTIFSDGEVWPTTRVMEAWQDGLDAIAITDHVGHHPHRADVSTDLRRVFEVARPEADRLGVILIPGVEVMEGNTHFNVLFVTDAMAFGSMKLLPALRAAAAQKAFVLWNHPGWKEIPRWSELVATAHQESLFQGVELVNGLTFYPEVLPLARAKGLTMLANSDVHGPIRTEFAERTRPITLVLSKTRDAAGIREALDAGRTAVWVNGQVWGDAAILAALWAGSIEPQGARVSLSGSGRSAALTIVNRSAIPFHTRVVGCPGWLYCGGAGIEPRRAGLLAVSPAKNPPAGVHRVELELEVTNLHTGPDSNLRVRLPVEVEIRP